MSLTRMLIANNTQRCLAARNNLINFETILKRDGTLIRKYSSVASNSFVNENEKNNIKKIPEKKEDWEWVPPVMKPQKQDSNQSDKLASLELSKNLAKKLLEESKSKDKLSEKEIERLKFWSSAPGIENTKASDNTIVGLVGDDDDDNLIDSRLPRKIKQVPVIPNVPLTGEDVVQILDNNGGLNIEIIKEELFPSLWDSRVLCDGKSSLHVLKLANAIVRALKSRGLASYVPRMPVQGSSDRWMVVDTEDVIVYIFHDKSNRNELKVKKEQKDG